MEITFKRTDDFTYEAHNGAHEAVIKHEYFGLNDYYGVFINGARYWTFDRLASAKRYAKEELLKKEA